MKIFMEVNLLEITGDQLSSVVDETSMYPMREYTFDLTTDQKNDVKNKLNMLDKEYANLPKAEGKGFFGGTKLTPLFNNTLVPTADSYKILRLPELFGDLFKGYTDEENNVKLDQRRLLRILERSAN